MNKRQLRQSAVDDFLQSLEHLDELLGDTTETVVLDSESPTTEPDRSDAVAAPSHQPQSAKTTNLD